MQEPTTLLKNAVEDIVGNINVSAMSPHDAVVKAAKEHNLNPNFIKRAAEVVNVALTYSHFKKNAEQRDADFPIVDAQAVIGEVFNPATKTALEIKSTLFSRPISTEIPDFAKISSPAYKQATAEILESGDTSTEFPLSDKAICEKSAHIVEKLEKEVSALETAIAGHHFGINNTFSVLAAKFAKDQNYRTSFPEFESQVFSTHGDRAVPYLDLMHKSAGITEERGAHDNKYQMFDICAEAELFNSLVEHIDGYNADNTKLAEKKQLQADTQEMIRTVYHKFAADKYGANASVDPVLSRLEQFSVISEKSASTADPVTELILKKNEALTKLSKFVEGLGAFFGDADKAYGRTPDAAFRSNTGKDNAARKLILQELIVHDPVLSSTPPHKVLGAYEQFIRLAPDLSREKEVVRAALRAMISSEALSPHEAQLYVEANSSLVKQRLINEVGEKAVKPVTV